MTVGGNDDTDDTKVLFHMTRLVNYSAHGFGTLDVSSLLKLGFTRSHSPE
jgi:hypothetical protein